MNLTKATKNQLLTIALHEDCDFSFKYEACRELQTRRWRDEMTTDLVRMWPFYNANEISIKLGVPIQTIGRVAYRLGLPIRRNLA